MAGLTNPMTPPPAGPAAPPSPVASAPPMPGGTPAPAPAAPPSPGGQPQPQGQSGGAPITMGPVDPELEKKFIANCMNVVTGSLQQIIKSVTQSQDKVEALAQSAVFVVVRVEDSLEQSGQQLNLNMTFDAGAETITDIADAVKKAGVYSYQQKELDAAFLRAVDQYRMVRQKQGRLDPAMFQSLIAQMKQQQQAGTLDQAFPGLSDFAKQAQTAAKPAGADDGDGPDAEDSQDQQDDFVTPGAAAATPGSITPKTPAATPAAGQNFPPELLKKKPKGTHLVRAHLRHNPGTAAAPAKAKPKPKVSSKSGVPGNDFSPTMLKAKQPKKAGKAFAPAAKPVKGGV